MREWYWMKSTQGITWLNFGRIQDTTDLARIPEPEPDKTLTCTQPVSRCWEAKLNETEDTALYKYSWFRLEFVYLYLLLDSKLDIAKP